MGTPQDSPNEQRKYPEVSISAVVFAIFIGIVMNASITLAGLRIGFTITGSAIAALLGFGILRGILRRGSILETNIAQTVASGVNIPNSGVIFTVPVLIILGTTDFSAGSADFWLLTFSCVAGGLLGCAFIIPLRKQMIDIDRLRFPTATGVATILKSPGAGPKKALVLLVGVVIAGLLQLPKGLPGIPRNATVEQLDALVASERVSPETAEFTRTLDSWIEQKRAPDPVVEHGRREANRIELQQKFDAGGNVAQQLAAAKVALADSSVQVPLNVALEAYRASQGEVEWESLRRKKLGWAQNPLPGYADIDLRAAPVTEQRDTDGDGVAETVLTRGSDRDQNGKPDLLLTDSQFDAGRWLGLPDEMQLVFAIAPFALGAGFITGFAGLFVLAGGILAFLFLNPIAFNLGWFPATTVAHAVPGLGYSLFNRPLGIGLLLGGAGMGILASLPAIKEALRSIIASSRAGSSSGSDELGFRPIAFACALALVLLFIAADYVGHRPLNDTCPVTSGVTTDASRVHAGYVIEFSSEEAATEWMSGPEDVRSEFLATHNARPGLLAGLNLHLRALLIAIIGALWMWFAGIIIAQCTGMTDWSPISGMALLTVVLVMLLAGTGAVFGAVLIGAALCVAITLASDMMGDMKTGYLVGAQPRRQQLLELGVVWIGPIVAMFTILFIVNYNTSQGGPALGPGSPLQTGAPQAQALAAIINGIQGGDMPYALYALGAIAGAILGLGAFSGLGVLVGLSMYLPFMYIATYGIGCVANIALRKLRGPHWVEEWGVPFAAGLIVGDSVVEMTINGIQMALG